MASPLGLAVKSGRPQEAMQHNSVVLVDEGAKAIMQDRLERAMHLAKTRLERDARALAVKLEGDLVQRVGKAEQQYKEFEQMQTQMIKEIEREEELEKRARALQQRQELVEAENERLRAQVLAEAIVQDRRRAAWEAKWLQGKEGEMLYRRAEGEARDARVAATVARGRALELERAAKELRRQEQVMCLRAEASVALATEKARIAIKRRVNSKALEERQKLHGQEMEFRRCQKEAMYGEKLARISRKEELRDEFLRDIAHVREETARAKDTLHAMAYMASVTNNDQCLRSHLETLVPRLARAPHPPPVVNISSTTCRRRARTSSPALARHHVAAANTLRTPRARHDQFKISSETASTFVSSMDPSGEDSCSEPSFTGDSTCRFQRMTNFGDTNFTSRPVH